MANKKIIFAGTLYNFKLNHSIYKRWDKIKTSNKKSNTTIKYESKHRLPSRFKYLSELVTLKRVKRRYWHDYACKYVTLQNNSTEPRVTLHDYI